MNINWKVRLQSKPFWVALFALIGFILGEFDVYHAGRYEVLVQLILAVLVTIGVIVDPTTTGVTDSKTALEYEKPKDDK